MIIFSSGLMILAALPTKDLHILPVRSLYETFLHVQPYSSGMTRAVSSFLHGRFLDSWNYNPLVYVLLPIAIFILAKDVLYISRTRDFSL